MKNPEETPNIGKKATVTDSLLGKYTDIGPYSVIHESDIGDYAYCAGYNEIRYAGIGKFCSIAAFVTINPGNHPTYARAAQHHFTYRRKQYGMAEEDDRAFFEWRKSTPVTLGHDVWVGHGAVILPGVSIGSGAVIGAGAVVSHDVGPYEVAAGVPARVIKRRFTEDICHGLERTRWWDWDHETLRSRLNDFNDVERFIALYAAEEEMEDEHT